MNKKQKYFLIFDIGGTRLRAAIGTEQGKIIKKIEEFTPVEKGAEGTIRKIVRLGKKIQSISGIDIKNMGGIGVSFGGPIDFENQKVIKSQHVEGWENIPLGNILEKEFGLPVVVDNDGNTAALGEYLFGGGRGISNMVYLTISTGVGGGIILGGKVLHGKNNLAGEVGHIIVEKDGLECECGKKGCVEAYASGTAIAKNSRNFLIKNPNAKSMIRDLVNNEIEKVTAITIFEAIRQGDKLAEEIVDQSLRYLGIAIGNIVSILDIERIVIGGGVTYAKKLFFPKIREYIAKYSMFQDDYEVEVVRAKNKNTAGLKGAIALAMSLD